MQLIRSRTYARCGLVGNPSDGYHGKVISVLCPAFYAEVVLYPWKQLEIIPHPSDGSSFSSLDAFVKHVEVNGYYGAIRLIKAAIKAFYDHCRQRELKLRNDNFSIRYTSNIPRSVGLAGSSAIIISTLKALMEFYSVSIEPYLLPSLALKVETDELGIPGGLQDRVIQVLGGVIAMDFSQAEMKERWGLRYGSYQSIEPKLLPPLYMAYDTRSGEPTEVIHNDLRRRFNANEPEVLKAMDGFVALTDRMLQALKDGNHGLVSEIMDANFDLRRSILNISKRQLEMVITARQAGVSAKFAGSGGAIVGCYFGEDSFAKLKALLSAIGCTVVKLTLT